MNLRRRPRRLSSIDPIKGLFWSAVINGVAAVPIMVMMMLITSNTMIMRKFVVTGARRVIVWLATAVMAAAAGLCEGAKRMRME